MVDSSFYTPSNNADKMLEFGHTLERCSVISNRSNSCLVSQQVYTQFVYVREANSIIPSNDMLSKT